MSLYEDDECINSACHTEITQLKQQIGDSEKRISEAKKKYHELLALNLKKDIQISQLEQKMMLYNGFRGVISDKAIDVLNSIQLSKSKDSFFILTAVKDLYREDLLKLKQKTFSGRKNVTANTSKEPISPAKKNVLKELFQQRMSKIPGSENRMNCLAKHVKQAIETINTTNK